jgi:CHAT domain-containing protein
MITKRVAPLILAACVGCERPAPSNKTTEVSGEIATTQVPRAESLYFAGEYDSAGVAWRKELASAQASNDSARQAHLLMWLGLTAWRQGDNAEARTLGEQALDLKKRLPGNHDLSRSYNALGLLARDEGRLRDAAALFDNAASSARAVADTAGVSRAAANLALIQLELGEFDKARAGFEAARDAGRALGDRRVEGNALNNLGMLAIKLGDPLGALTLINQAVGHYRAIEYPTGIQNAYGQIATAYDLIGDPQRSLAYLDSASQIARESDMKTEEASNLRLTGQVYAVMEDHRRALSFFEQSLRLSRNAALRLEEATTLRSASASHLALGNGDVATRNTLDALRIHRGEGAVWEELADLLMLAELAAVAGGPADAQSRLNEARSLARRIGARRARAEVALTEARIAAKANRSRDVLRILRDARQDLSDTRADVAWEPLSLRAKAFSATGELDSAIVTGREAVRAVERVRGRIVSSVLRTSFTAARAGVYSDQVIAFLRQGRQQEAFEVADAARGRALIEHLSQARAGLGAASPATRDIVRGEVLLRQIDELVSLLEQAQQTPREERSLDDRALDELSSRVKQAENEYAALLERAAASDTAQASLLGISRVTTRDVQSVLGAGEVLVEYLVTPDRTIAFVVRRGRVDHVEIPLSDSVLSARVRFARELLARPGDDSTAVQSSLARLHEALVGTVEQKGLLRDVSRLIVVPHSALSYLPFAALRARDGRYLAERVPVLTLPSAGALFAMRRHRSPQESRVTTLVFAPFTRDLPATRAEARSVASVAGKARTLRDQDASERAFRAAAGEGRVLHLATHGVLNPQNPMFSRIELARPQGVIVPADDGRLSVHELIGMKTRAPLVFLSGCETALGGAWATDFVRGEDYATLSQALLYAGARAAIATLWRINDESAATFAGHFYRSLRTLPPPEALAAAQQKMLIDGRYRAPYHWAAYQVAGSGDRITFEKKWWGLFAR